MRCGDGSEPSKGEGMLDNLEVFYKLLIALSLLCLGVGLIPSRWAIGAAVCAGVAALLVLLALLS